MIERDVHRIPVSITFRTHVELCTADHVQLRIVIIIKIVDAVLATITIPVIEFDRVPKSEVSGTQIFDVRDAVTILIQITKIAD